MEVPLQKLFIFFYIFGVLNFDYVFCVPDNSHHIEGDVCELNNNQNGICTEIRSCEYVKRLIADRRLSEVSRCQFKERTPIVCCPRDTPGLTQKQPKSKKFSDALCKDKYTVPVQNSIEKSVVRKPASVGEFPFHVAIGYPSFPDNEIKYKCGGSLIADDVVLTVAHCVNRKDNKPVTVKLGRTSLVPDEKDNGDGEDIEIQSIKIHANYSRVTHHNNIALIKLKHPTKFTWPIQTVCLSSDDNNLPNDFTASGHGILSTTLERSIWLSKVNLNIVPLEECQNIYRNLTTKIGLVETQLCAVGLNGAGPCQGDSGGPLSYRKNGTAYLYGIISNGVSCGADIPGVYTKVNQYLEWIDDVMYEFDQSQESNNVFY